MKILSAKQLRAADAYTITHESIKSIDLMERAANACVEWIKAHIDASRQFKMFCGLGNNGGDGLAIARMLLERNYKVSVYIVQYGKTSSADFKLNEQRFKEISTDIIYLTDSNTEITLSSEDIIIDAIFGSGLNRPIEGWAKDIIRLINNSNSKKISIDVPSGLFCDDNSENDYKNIIKAEHTLTFEAPKLSFLFPSDGDYAGAFTVLDIGLDKGFIAAQDSTDYFIVKEDVQKLRKRRKKFSHKGTYGHALLLAGSYGKMGAAILASKACLRSGVGLLTAHVPEYGYTIMQMAVPEAMVNIDSSGHFISDSILPDNYSAIGLGPGIGNAAPTQNVLKLLIQNSPLPMLIDADAINILSENKTWISFVPPDTIFTPHPKEFERLVGKASNDYERYNMQKEFAVKYGVYLILKGAHTAIACPNGEVLFNSTGNPGMATGGSGDVLTGIITGLLAQGYSSRNACIIGVYLHGLAGDLAAEKVSEEALIASDIVNFIGDAFNYLYKR